jgi:hypothetical protein
MNKFNISCVSLSTSLLRAWVFLVWLAVVWLLVELPDVKPGFSWDSSYTSILLNIAILAYTYSCEFECKLPAQGSFYLAKVWVETCFYRGISQRDCCFRLTPETSSGEVSSIIPILAELVVNSLTVSEHFLRLDQRSGSFLWFILYFEISDFSMYYYISCSDIALASRVRVFSESDLISSRKNCDLFPNLILKYTRTIQRWSRIVLLANWFRRFRCFFQNLLIWFRRSI